jgi:hypothetical protein
MHTQMDRNVGSRERAECRDDYVICPRCRGAGMIYRPEVIVAVNEYTADYSEYTIGGDDACPSCAKMAELEYERYQRFEAMKR